MFLRGQTVVLLPLLAYVVVDLGSACTAVGVTPGASVDGSAFVSHSSDAEGEGDPRVYKVEAKTHKPGTLRPVFDYPAGLSGARKPPIGHIPQVARTHGYLRETYGMMNDKQVSIGESTTSSKSPIDEVQPASRGGTALLSAVTLTEIGLERCDTARCACETMGTLSEQFGFFQDAGTPTGEAFLVGDRNEVWIFHILPPLKAEDTYGAIWAAARVPDGHVTALPNTFTIRGIDLEDGANFLYSQSLVGAAEAVGGWRAGEALDFTKVFGAGEYGSKYYSGRRVWRALTLLGSPEVAASLPAEYGDLHADAPYPPSVRATPRSVALSHVLAVHRDYYQGTKYDLSKGLAAGPWGTPNRFMFPADSINAWERSITLFRTVDSYVAQSRGWLADEVGGTIWYGPHAAHGTVYVPLSPAMAQATLPPAYTSSFEMTSGALDRRGAFWAHAATQALAEGRFAWIQSELSALQAVLEKEGLQAQATVDTTAAAAGGPMFDGDKAQARYAPLRDHASRVAAQCWQLFDQLVFRYADGFVRPRGVRASPVGMGYPAWWLEAVGYDHSKAVGVGSLAQAAPGAGKVPARAQLLPGVDATPLAAVGPLRQSAAEGGEGASGSAQSNCNVPIATLAADLSEDGSQPVVVGGRSGGGATPFAAVLGLLVVVAVGFAGGGAAAGIVYERRRHAKLSLLVDEPWPVATAFEPNRATDYVEMSGP